MVVTIQISDEVWKELVGMKTRPSKTFDDIIKELLLIKKEESK